MVGYELWAIKFIYFLTQKQDDFMAKIPKFSQLSQIPNSPLNVKLLGRKKIIKQKNQEFLEN